MLWLGNFRSAAIPRGRDTNEGVVPVEFGGVESIRQISLDERADVCGGTAWDSLGMDEAGVASCDLFCIVDATSGRCKEKAGSSR